MRKEEKEEKNAGMTNGSQAIQSELEEKASTIKASIIWEVQNNACFFVFWLPFSISAQPLKQHICNALNRLFCGLFCFKQFFFFCRGSWSKVAVSEQTLRNIAFAIFPQGPWDRCDCYFWRVFETGGETKGESFPRFPLAHSKPYMSRLLFSLGSSKCVSWDTPKWVSMFLQASFGMLHFLHFCWGRLPFGWWRFLGRHWSRILF